MSLLNNKSKIKTQLKVKLFQDLLLQNSINSNDYGKTRLTVFYSKGEQNTKFAYDSVTCNLNLRPSLHVTSLF